MQRLSESVPGRPNAIFTGGRIQSLERQVAEIRSQTSRAEAVPAGTRHVANSQPRNDRRRTQRIVEHKGRRRHFLSRVRQARGHSKRVVRGRGGCGYCTKQRPCTRETTGQEESANRPVQRKRGRVSRRSSYTDCGKPTPSCREQESKTITQFRFTKELIMPTATAAPPFDPVAATAEAAKKDYDKHVMTIRSGLLAAMLNESFDAKPFAHAARTGYDAGRYRLAPGGAQESAGR